MKVVKKYEMLQPKTGETHRLFGVRYLYRHRMRDKKWTAADKILQYSGVTRLYERDHALQNISAIADRKKKQEFLKKLKNKLKDLNNLLYKATYNDVQRIKSMLQHDKYMTRTYPKWKSDVICERIDNLTFVKRKQLDNLKEIERKLTEEYEARLFEVAQLQDRIKYFDELEPEYGQKTRKIEAESKDSETRNRAIASINRAYKQIMDLMHKDSIYYDSVLDALKSDLTEQDLFIQKTILLGQPAIDTSEELEKAYNDLEQKTKKETDIRIKDLLENREKIIADNERVRTLVRRDEDFEIFPTRYSRDTPKITDLKKELEHTEMLIKELNFATATCDPLDIYPKMKKQIHRNKAILGEVKFKEKERNLVIEQNLHADIIQEALKFDLTDDEISKLGNIDSMMKQIAEEKKKQQELDSKIKERGDNFVLIRLAFQHVLEVLNFIGKPLEVKSKKPCSSIMDLPLLKFDKIVQKYKPPPDIEQNIDNLLKAAKSKIELVTKKYNDEVTKEIADDAKTVQKDEQKAKNAKEGDQQLLKKLRAKQKGEEKIHNWKDYHCAIVKELTSGYKTKQIEVETKEGWAAEDTSVVTRVQVKQQSAKIVEEMSKKED